uniref:Symplekin_C domain-containing protein n=1 Tax=Mesocestoides corti TaxID=53468 RepID=A0A5K3FXI9_MESCO
MPGDHAFTTSTPRHTLNKLCAGDMEEQGITATISVLIAPPLSIAPSPANDETEQGDNAADSPDNLPRDANNHQTSLMMVPYVSPTVFTTQLHTHGIPNDPPLIPYPYGEETKAFFANLRLKLTSVPQFLIDFMGYVPNSEIRQAVGSWVTSYLEYNEDDYAEDAVIPPKILKHIKLRDKAKAVMLNTLMRKDGKLTEVTQMMLPFDDDDDDYIDFEEEPQVSKADAERLKRIRRQVTRDFLSQNVPLREKRRENKVTHYNTFTAPNTATSITAPTYQEGVSPAAPETPEDIGKKEGGPAARKLEAKSSTKAPKAEDTKPASLLPHRDVTAILEALRGIVGGSDAAACQVIAGCLLGNRDNLTTLAAVITDPSTQQNFLRTIQQPTYMFYLLNSHFKSPRTVLNMISIVVSDDSTKTVERIALTKKLNECLGQAKKSNVLVNFVKAFDETCEVAVLELLKRVSTGTDLDEVKSAFHESLCDEEIQMAELADAAQLEKAELETIVQLTLSCQIEELRAFFADLPILSPKASMSMELSPDLFTQPHFHAESLEPRLEVHDVVTENASDEEELAGKKFYTERKSRYSSVRPSQIFDDDDDDSLRPRPVVKMKPPPLKVRMPISPTEAPTSPSTTFFRSRTVKRRADNRFDGKNTRSLAIPASVLADGAASSTPPSITVETQDEDDSYGEEMSLISDLVLPDLLSPESESESAQTPTEAAKPQAVRIKYRRSRRHRRQKKAEEVREKTDSAISSSLGSSVQERPMTEDEIRQKAIDDEVTCMDLIAMLKSLNDLEEAQGILKKLRRIIR